MCLSFFMSLLYHFTLYLLLIIQQESGAMVGGAGGLWLVDLEFLSDGEKKDMQPFLKMFLCRKMMINKFFIAEGCFFFKLNLL